MIDSIAADALRPRRFSLRYPMKRRMALAALLALVALALAGCRFVAVESGEAVVIAPAETEPAGDSYATQN